MRNVGCMDDRLKSTSCARFPQCCCNLLAASKHARHILAPKTRTHSNYVFPLPPRWKIFRLPSKRRCYPKRTPHRSVPPPHHPRQLCERRPSSNADVPSRDISVKLHPWYVFIELDNFHNDTIISSCPCTTFIFTALVRGFPYGCLRITRRKTSPMERSHQQ